MNQILVEENGVYGLDCTHAVWATNEIHEKYHKAGLHILSDADFVIETEDELIMIEYKNASIPDAEKPEVFNPLEDKKFNGVLRKYYDTLHYLTLNQKDRPKHFVYIVETLNDGVVMRKRLRDRLVRELPFQLQEIINSGVKLIEGVDVLSIEEWNNHPKYGAFPLKPVNELVK